MRISSTALTALCLTATLAACGPTGSTDPDAGGASGQPGADGRSMHPIDQSSNRYINPFIQAPDWESAISGAHRFLGSCMGSRVIPGVYGVFSHYSD